MVDFFKPARRIGKNCIEVYPEFEIRKSSDLMIKGGDFYAIWLEDKGLWSTDEDDLNRLIDAELDRYAKELRKTTDESVKVLHMKESRSGSYDVWHKYCTKQMRKNYHDLDEKLIFQNDETTKKDYATKKLPYSLAEGSIENYDEIMSALYSPEERHKIEWAVGSIVNGDSKKIQKFLVFYGSSGTGKSTVLNIIQKLFEGYYCVFDAKALGQTNNSFALEPFKDNPLVAIQHDGDLSHIEDNTRLNSVVSHEEMVVNEKFTKLYSSKFKAFLFMGTNRPVKITDAKSGIIRRLIDVTPLALDGKSKNIIPRAKYNKLMKNVDYELGAIAYHCKEVYEADPHYYDDYIPLNMLGASNPFYNFIEDSFYIFKDCSGMSLKNIYKMYETYCDDWRIGNPLPRMIVKEELKNYFEKYTARYVSNEGIIIRDYYENFITDKFEKDIPQTNETEKINLIDFRDQPSMFDLEFADCHAQYGTDNDTPKQAWTRVETTLKDLDTHRVHYVLPQEKAKNLIMIDFDIPGEDGSKNFEANLKEASKFYPTYAELSKSGSGIHLLYYYTGDISKLSGIYADHIEIKKFTGKSAMRRRLTKCNNLPIAIMSSGLPLKEEPKNVIDKEKIKDETHLVNCVKKALRWYQAKQNKIKMTQSEYDSWFKALPENYFVHMGTSPNISYIKKVLDDAYAAGFSYDITRLRPAISAFATNSTNHPNDCIKLVNQMHFKSADIEETEAAGIIDISTEEKKEETNSVELVFFDVEVFKNLFIVCWKKQGTDIVNKWFNPSHNQMEFLFSLNLVGFNNKRYDNIICYAWYIGYNNEQLFKLSQDIISNKSNITFKNEAANVSYTDVYDFSSKKQSLKKFEIELGIFHQEWGHKWDEPVPEDLWEQAADYCANDVKATEAVFNARHDDFVSREMLADITGMTVNASTNSLTTRLIFGNNRTPQNEFNYRDMGDIESIDISGFSVTNKNEMMVNLDPDYTAFNKDGYPVFPGYKYEKGVSTYRGEEVGEGGYVYAEPGMYCDVALLDIASMHPSSIVAENLFGDRYTDNFHSLLQARIAIKHKDFEKVRSMYDGKLAKYLEDPKSAKKVSQALKIAINSVYGLTSASFVNPFRDPRNIDNIVAKRGALFMINLKHEVQRRGFTVAHIKTDSIKIPNATPEIIKFVMDYGKMYGYNFEHEATYDRMCLVNNAVYIAKFKEPESCKKLYGYSPDECVEAYSEGGQPWTPTGAQFAHPYVFKTLFSKEKPSFDDMCETKSVTSALYLDMNESNPDEHNYVFVGKVGRFVPVIPGADGGLLMREKDGKYSAATGTIGFRWKEATDVKDESIIDISYYEILADEAREAIAKYGDFSWFVSNESYEDYVNRPPWEAAS